MALSLVLTLSRSGITALAGTVAVTGAFLSWRPGSIGRRTIAIGYLLLLVVIVVGWAGVDTLAARFSQADWGELDARRGAWQDATHIAQKFPVTGIGLNTYGVATLFYQRPEAAKHFAQAHNDYLQLAAEGGMLVVIPVLFTIAAFVVVVRRRLVEEISVHAYWLRMGAITGLAAIALQETVDFSLQMPGNAALCAVLCGIALHQSPRSPEKRKTSEAVR
jgi:O-antigen ligase